MLFRRFLLVSFLCSLLIAFSGCSRQRPPLGSAENPIKLYFVPSVDVKVLEDNSKTIESHLESATPYEFEVAIPASYVAVVEAFGTRRADVAALNTFGYIMANERYGAEAKLTVLRFGSPTYRSQFIARKDSGIESVEDIAGMKMAFVDPASTSGYLLPLKVLKDKEVSPSETVFAMRHDNVVSMVYQRQVDAGATFYSPEADGVIQDARRLVKTQFPDVADEVVIVELTDEIPNDPITFRRDVPEEIKETVIQALLDYIETDEGREAFKNLYAATGFQRAEDADYDGVRAMLQAAGKSAEQLASE